MKKILTLLLSLLMILSLVGCNNKKQEETISHTHTYEVDEDGVWKCSEDNDILSNTDKPYVAVLDNNEPKDIISLDSITSNKTNLGNGVIYKEDNTIFYNGNNSQSIIIKTEKDNKNNEDKVVINAPNDTVYHYGSSSVISLDAVATESFHEYGRVDLITLTKARIVLETLSNVKEIYLDINNPNYNYESAIIAIKEEVELPNLSRDAVDLKEGEVKTLAVIQQLKDETKQDNTVETKTEEESFVKIENVGHNDKDLIIKAFLSPNSDTNDNTKLEKTQTSTVTLEEAKEGSNHPASKNTFVSKDEKVIEVVKPTETPEKQEETKPVVNPTVNPKQEEKKDDPTPTPTPTPTPVVTKYTVTFDMNGHGTQIPSQSIEKNNKVTKPIDPIVDGYTFDGWYKEKACTNAWNFDTDVVISNTTIYAKWSKLVEKPTAVSGLIYTGEELTGVAEGTGYTVENGKATNAGSYTATVKLLSGYKWSDDTTSDLEINWSIAKAEYDMSAVSFEDKEVTYNGQEQKIEISGTLPEGVTVSYTSNKGTNADTYDATASFVGDSDNYDAIDDMNALLKINKASLTATADGKAVTVGDEAPEYTVTYTGWVNGESIDTVSPTTAAVLACSYTTTSSTGEYDITFKTEPVFANYTVTAVPGKLTVAPITIDKVLSTVEDFPTSVFPDSPMAPNNAWVNTTDTNDGVQCFLFNDRLIWGNFDDYAKVSTIITKSGNNYIGTSKNGVSITFNMTDEILTSITISGSSYSTENGTYKPKVSVTSVSLDKNELAIAVGDSDVKLTATVSPDNATRKKVRWESSNKDVATVDSEGNVHAVAAGTAIITVTTVDGSKTDTCNVTVGAKYTVADVIALCEDFPSTLDRGWKRENDENTKIYYNSSLTISDPDHSRNPRILAISTQNVSATTGGYTCQTSLGLLTFNVSEGKLMSINLNGTEEKINGIYSAPIDKASYTMKKGSEWFSSFSSTTTDKKKITDIVFTKDLPQGVDETKGVNLTDSENGKVKGYIVTNGDNFKIYIVGDYIFGNVDCFRMFNGFTNLTSLNLSNFNTSNVTNMLAMFMSCSKLESLDISKFDTSNVTDMQNIFANCNALTSLNLSKVNTSKVTNMTNMFLSCKALTSLDLSKFDTTSVTAMNGMFNGCEKLNTITFGTNFNTSKVTTMADMFKECKFLTALNLSNFDTSSVTTMANMFQDCEALESLNISSFNTTKVTTMKTMFQGCKSLTALDLSSFDTSEVTDMSTMFNSCSKLTSLDLSKFNTLKATGNVALNNMFGECLNLSSVKIETENEKIAAQLGTGWTYNGSNKAYEKASETKTIADILETLEFPTSDDINTPPSNAWTNDNSIKCFIAVDEDGDSGLQFEKQDSEGKWVWLHSIGLNNEVEKNENGYCRKQEAENVQFNIDNDGILTSIVLTGENFSNLGDDEISIEGTYRAPVPAPSCNIIYKNNCSSYFSTAPTYASEGTEVTIVPNAAILLTINIGATVDEDYHNSINNMPVASGLVIKFNMPAFDVTVEAIAF